MINQMPKGSIFVINECLTPTLLMYPWPWWGGGGGMSIKYGPVTNKIIRFDPLPLF